jgi:hypothetical protein
MELEKSLYRVHEKLLEGEQTKKLVKLIMISSLICGIIIKYEYNRIIM